MPDRKNTRKNIRDIVCLSDKINIPAPRKLKTTSILPALQFIKTDKQDDSGGAFMLADGSIKQVVKCNGLNIVYDDERLDQLETSFAKFLLDVSCDVQIVVRSKPFVAADYQKRLDSQVKTQNDYLVWAADYHAKWMTRVCDVTFVPDKQYFIVVSAKPGARHKLAGNVQPGKPTAAQLKQLETDVARLCTFLKKHKQAPIILDKQETRTMLSGFAFPITDSFGFNQKDIPETPLAPSAVLEPITHETTDEVRAGSIHHRCFVLANLPAKAHLGWLAGLQCKIVPVTVSMHFKQCDQNKVRKQIAAAPGERHPELAAILKGTDKAVDFAVYLSTWSDKKDACLDQSKELREFFSNCDAGLVEARGYQMSALRSIMPTGEDDLELTHKLSTSTATLFWPLFTGAEQSDAKGKLPGLPVGFSTPTREPVEIAVDSIFVAGGRPSTTAGLIGLMVSKFLFRAKPVVYVGCSEQIKFYTQCLGNPLAQAFSPKDSVNRELAPVRFVDTTGMARLDRATLALIGELTQRSAGGLICLEDVGQVLPARGGLLWLQTLMHTARAKKAGIIFGASGTVAAEARSIALADYCRQKLIVAHAMPRALLTALDIKAVEIRGTRNYESAILIKNGTHSLVRQTYSPMDAGTFPDPLWCKGRPYSKVIARRNELMAEILNKNPKMTGTDIARQAVYYLGLQGHEE